MSIEDRFLEQIRERPEDRSVRLIYADWLEERGDARSELIRLEEEMAVLPVWSDRYFALKPRRHTLREQVAPAWREALGYVPRHRPMFGQLPPGRHERWRLFRELWETWRPHIELRGVSREALAECEERRGVQFPAALREWYLLAGGVEIPLAPGSRLAPLSLELPLEYTNLVPFIINAPRTPIWGYRSTDASDDPPVYRLTRLQEVQSRSMTGCAIRQLFFELCRGTHGYQEVTSLGCNLNADHLSEVRRQFVRCDISEFGEGLTFYERENVLLAIANSIALAIAKTRSAFRQLSQPLRDVLQERFF